MSGEKRDWHPLPHLPEATWQTLYHCATGDKAPQLTLRWRDTSWPHRKTKHTNTYQHPFTGSLLAKQMPTSPPISPCSKTTIQASSSLGRDKLPWLQSILETSPLNRALAGSIRSGGPRASWPGGRRGLGSRDPSQLHGTMPHKGSKVWGRIERGKTQK